MLLGCRVGRPPSKMSVFEELGMRFKKTFLDLMIYCNALLYTNTKTVTIMKKMKPKVHAKGSSFLKFKLAYMYG